MDIFEAWPAALPLISVAVGLCIGSFLNVVAYRLPIMLERAWREGTDDQATEAHETPGSAPEQRFDLAWPGSFCPHCGTAIAAWHNIPVLGFALLRGRCAHCAEPISWRYPIVEALTAVLSLVVALAFGATWMTVAALVFTWFLVAMSLIDLDHKLLPDDLTLPLMWIGLLISVVDFGDGPLFADVRGSVIGAAAGYLSLWSVFHLFKLVTGKEGMGYGDFKLFAALGAWLGWQMLPLIIVLSAAAGSAVGLALIATGRSSRQTALPFGPFLAGAGWIALLVGPELMDRYLGLVSQ